MSNHQPVELSEHNHNLFLQLEDIALRYPISLEKLQELILTIDGEDANQANLIATRTEALFKRILMTLLDFEVDMTTVNWQQQCGLPEDRLLALKDVLEAVCGGPCSQKLKRSVVISFIENVLECLGVSDLTEVLNVISCQIPRFANQLEKTDQVRLLRVINVLLKTVSKTEDYYLRGQLHLALTRLLPFCDDSGFHFRAPPSKASDWQKLSTEEQGGQSLESGITYEFYEQFWQLQKWLLQPNEIAGEGMLNRLKKVQQVLKEVQLYFSTHPAQEGIDYYNQPIKFLKNYNLLGLQLKQPTFRKTIMLQILLFVHALLHPLARAPIALAEPEKKVIGDIEAIAKKFMMSCGVEGHKLLQILPKLMAGEQEWMELKEQWKDKKKTFLKRAETYAEQQAKNKDQNRKVQKQIEKRRGQIRKLIAEKMKIQGSKIEKFLQNSEPISLQSGPTYTSFSYFFSQAMGCLQSFDRQSGKQTQFQTRAQYNMFEWKAMRSLYRENIKDIWSSNDKAPPKMKEYRLISLMNRKQEEFSEPEPTKKVKQQ